MADHPAHDVPNIPEDVLIYLRRLFPEAPPSITDSERLVWFKAGQASVAGLLERVQAQETARVLHVRQSDTSQGGTSSPGPSGGGAEHSVGGQVGVRDPSHGGYRRDSSVPSQGPDIRWGGVSQPS